MPQLHEFFLKQLKCDYSQYKVFIESGTLQGLTIFTMEPLFEKLYTIELSEKYYNETRNRYIGNKIQFLHGDSSKVFRTLLPAIQEGAIFFLDGHWSSGDTARGDKDCPLIEEVTAISELFNHYGILIIDDYRLFGKNQNEDWSDIRKADILRILGDRIETVYHLHSDLALNDRLIIHINNGGGRSFT